MLNLLAIIPGRGGSKRLPRKVIAPLAGRPLISWTIDAARASEVCERIIVSTEDAEIAEMARGSGAEVPFLRPAALARDDVPCQAAIDHALAWLAKQERYVPEAVLVLQPTSPLRSGEDIRGAVKLLTAGANSVVSVTAATTPPHLLRQVDSDGRLSTWRAAVPPPESALARVPYYQVNGAIYLNRHPAHACTEAPLAYVMPPERSFDIDTPWDLRLAEAILKLSQA